MPLPKCSHQQLAVLFVLVQDGDVWGRDLRAALRKEGYKSTHASFYELLDRMEKIGLVESRFEDRDVLGQLFREKRYKITGLGQEALDEFNAFYAPKQRKLLAQGGVI
jgi:DNA-binding PadR family transcriptional regulator